MIFKYKSAEAVSHTSTYNIPTPFPASGNLHLEDFVKQKLFAYLIDSIELFFHWTA